MKKTSIVLSFLLIGSMVFGQVGKRREALEERVKSLKIAFVTEKLALTPDESEKFWPVYNQMEAERASLMAEKKSDFGDDITDKEAQLYITRHFDIREKEIQLERRYIDKFKTLLPDRKVAKLLWVEKQFRQEVMSNIINKARNRNR
ncbi:MAG: hypothetical protein IPP37_15940 [Saprospiraceae bacterium]|nr:hypothetical protein [Saprospiraceae bacterium]MBK7787375.1 hypothetical protein [Saprospiraceae bacterium]MBK8109809.1 hypothetical protein [Saprospiraceae bacterium]MBK9687764.1 hypothetical protein [Saprospiraceae bacterium]MBL0083808.1 hypothetical protein [Saprospiraceae bacterium]